MKSLPELFGGFNQFDPNKDAGEPCTRCGESIRYESTGGCVSCHRIWKGKKTANEKLVNARRDAEDKLENKDDWWG